MSSSTERESPADPSGPDRSQRRQRVARQATLLGMAITAFVAFIAVAFDWEGMIGLALGLILYFAALAHIPLGIVAVANALLSGRHLANLWVHAYFLIAGSIALGTVAEVQGWDRAAELAWERTSDAPTAELRAAAGYQVQAGRALAAVADGADVNLRHEWGRTPLMHAANAGETELVAALLAAGADVNAVDESGATALHWAAGGGSFRHSNPNRVAVNLDLVRDLVAAGARADQTSEEGWTPRLAACRAGSLEAVRWLESAGAAENERLRGGKGCMQLAAEHGHVHLVSELATSARAEDLGSALVDAARREDASLFRRLLELGAPPWVLTAGPNPHFERFYREENPQSAALRDALHELAADGQLFPAGGHAQLVQALGDPRRMRDVLALGADPNARGDRGESVLHTASWRYTRVASESIQLLVKAGADPDGLDGHGSAPLLIAARAGNSQMAEWLLAHGADGSATDGNGQDMWMLASAGGHAEFIQRLGTLGVALPAADRAGDVLVRARDEGAAMRALLDAGLPVNVRDRRGIPPVVEVAAYGEAEAMRALLDHGADLNAEGNSGYTPLTRAADAGREEIVRLLLDAGANPTARDGRARTALAAALRGARTPVIAELLAAGVTPNARELQRIREIVDRSSRSERTRNAQAAVRRQLGLPDPA